MSIDGLSNEKADALANNLFGILTADADFTLPAVDLTGAEYTVPSATDNALFSEISKITESDLTTRVVGGGGLFDGLMVALSGHLRVEYDKGRITGEDYAKAYIAMTQTALGSSVQYLLATDQAYWQAQLAQKQAQAAEAGVVVARLQAETAKAQMASARLETNTAAATYALTKMQISQADIQYALLMGQYEGVEFTNANILPAQLGQLTKETERMDYELDNILPKEVLKTDKAIEQATAQISMTTAQKDQVLYTTTAMLPAQKLGVDKENAIKDYQVVTFLPAQVAGITADTEGKEYTNDFILPAQKTSLEEQIEGHRAKTLDTRTDGVTPIAGAVGKQKDLHTQQIESYKRDAEAKVTKMLLDTWITGKSIDDAWPTPTQITNSYLDSMISGVRTNLDM